MKHEKLKEKGWSQKEVDHLQQHFRPVESRLLITMLLVLLLVAVIIVPYVYSLLGQVIPSGLFYTIIVLLAGLLGMSFAVLISDIDRLTNTHHVLLIIVIPIIAVIASFLSFTHVSGGLFAHNVYIASVLYTVSLVLSYGSIIRLKWTLKKQ
jgi:hypothetical protein